MIKEFSFIDAGRTFTCRAEARNSSQAETWWWFEVSSERYQRFAPFRAATSDTKKDVQTRIVQYYDTLLERRAAPAPSHWRGGGSPAAKAAATAAAAANAAAAAAAAQAALPVAAPAAE